MISSSSVNHLILEPTFFTARLLALSLKDSLRPRGLSDRMYILWTFSYLLVYSLIRAHVSAAILEVYSIFFVSMDMS